MPTTLATLLPLPARTGESKDPLRFEQICAWRGTLPEGHRFEATLALRQVLSRAVAWELIDVNPAKRGVSNPLRRFPEKRPFESWAEIAAIADRLGPVGGAMITFAAATGLRPAELVALEERDVDHLGGVVYVRRQLVRGQVRPTKTPRSMRPVPLQSVALEALERLPESESPLLFPSPRGGYFDRHYRHLARDGREHAVALFDAFAKETAAWTPGGRRNGHRKPARAKDARIE
jgi:integrase